MCATNAIAKWLLSEFPDHPLATKLLAKTVSTKLLEWMQQGLPLLHLHIHCRVARVFHSSTK